MVLLSLHVFFTCRVVAHSSEYRCYELPKLFQLVQFIMDIVALVRACELFFSFFFFRTVECIHQAAKNEVFFFLFFVCLFFAHGYNSDLTATASFSLSLPDFYG